MIREYSLVTPSLDGLIYHESMEYEGLKRPPEISRIFDRTRKLATEDKELRAFMAIDTVQNRKVLESYFHDLYGLLMKKLSESAVDADISSEQSVKLMAMLQEFIKIKQLLAGIAQIT